MKVFDIKINRIDNITIDKLGTYEEHNGGKI